MARLPHAHHKEAAQAHRPRHDKRGRSNLCGRQAVGNAGAQTAGPKANPRAGRRVRPTSTVPTTAEFFYCRVQLPGNCGCMLPADRPKLAPTLPAQLGVYHCSPCARASRSSSAGTPGPTQRSCQCPTYHMPSPSAVSACTAHGRSHMGTDDTRLHNTIKFARDAASPAELSERERT
jgi:hypothetical protein